MVRVRKNLFICLSVLVLSVFCAPCFAAWENPVRFSEEGDFWVTWTQESKNSADVFAAHFDGSKWLPAEQVSNRVGTDMSPSIILDETGTPVAVWSGALKGGGTGIFTSRRQKDGRWAEAVSIDAPDMEYDTTPAAVKLDGGQIAVVWAGVEDGDDEIWFSLSRDGGKSWNSAVMLSDNDAYPDVSPVISRTTDGELLVVWSAFDGTSYRLSFSVFNPENGQWSKEAVLSPALSVLAQEMPFFTKTSDGLSRVFWLEAKMCFSSVWKDGKWLEPEGVNFTDDFYNLLSSRRFPDVHNGRAWIAWTLADGTQQSVRLSSMFNLMQARVKNSTVPAAVSLADGFDMFANCVSSSAWADDAAADGDGAAALSAVIGFGDSITEGWDGENYESRLSVILGRAVINAGDGGERTSAGLNRIDGVLAANAAGFILILEGTNDCGDGRSPDTIAYNLGLMVSKSQNAGLTPYVATIMPRNDIFNDRVRDANVKLREMANLRGVRIAEMYAAFDGQDLNSLYADQRLHPNGAGFDIMASVWAAMFSSGGSSGGGCGRVDFTGSTTGGPFSVNFFWLILVGLWLALSSKRFAPARVKK